MTGKIIVTISFVFICISLYAQKPIVHYSIDHNGCVEIEIDSDKNHYYLLRAKENENSNTYVNCSMVKGSNGRTCLRETLGAMPKNCYRVDEFSISNPADIDNDNIVDIEELNNLEKFNPLNAGISIDDYDGKLIIKGKSDFEELCVQHNHVAFSEFLNGKQYVKFMILDIDSECPQIYFINSKHHKLHKDFAQTYGMNHLTETGHNGQIIYHPNAIAANGKLGAYTFTFSNGRYRDFDIIEKTNRVLAVNMPFLANNLSYYITENIEEDYLEDSLLFENSRVSVIFEKDLYANVHYLGMNCTEGYGYFKLYKPNETVSAKDIVLFESLPNTLPHVGGIITSAMQTPLCHINLRAMQDNVPNAFIRNPLEDQNISSLLNHYVYYKVDQSTYTLREASIDEVNNWYDAKRPKHNQIPPLNLMVTEILPLNDIHFEMYDAFGAKCSNLATMQNLDFEEDIIPDGFGIPFYYYQEFMKYNDFFDYAKRMMDNDDFKNKLDVRKEMLKDFRKQIKKAPMPEWMMISLSELQNEFPEGSSIRCRSSTNNEDLPWFCGAGLYDSKTQHPHEGHISKSVKQVYASLWNFRAFQEREFYRVNHYVSSMGVLCHLNYSDEKVNGVGLSNDFVYETKGNIYLNSQLGEDLITNPTNEATSEELLVEQHPEHKNRDEYLLLRSSSLLPKDSILMTKQQLNLLRNCINTIHKEFATLYNAEGNPSFGMDIEYKICKDNSLAIKQARPWVGYSHGENAPNVSEVDITCFPNPAKECIYIVSRNEPISSINIYDAMGNLMDIERLEQTQQYSKGIDIRQFSQGVYIVKCYTNNEGIVTFKFVKE